MAREDISLMKSACLVTSALALTLAMFSCSSDEKNGGGSGGSAGSGGKGASGGAGGGSGGSSGSGGSGGTGGAGGGDGAVDCWDKPPSDPGGMAEAGGQCCDGLGTCQDPAGLDPSQAEAFGLDDCKANANLKCAPPEGVDAGGRATCESVGGIEGRCIPNCFLLGRPESGNLPQGTCAATEKCAPCFSPLDASDTGACRIGSDAPTDPAPTPYASCGAPDAGGPAAGVCIPESAAPAGVTLPPLDCATGSLCAPKKKVENQAGCFTECNSIIGRGGCVPAYVVPPDTVSLLMQDICEAGELCAPCTNPTAGNARTGACD